MPVLAIGNGESRTNIDLTPYTKKYLTVGCNALIRDYDVDHLVCVDRRMVTEAVALNKQCRIYTRPDWIDQFQSYPQVTTVPKLPYKGDQRADEPFQWGSGPYAILLAANLCTDTVYMMSFDLYGKVDKVNNVYKGTSNYVKDDSHAIDPSYWIHQTKKVFESFPELTFVIVNDDDWPNPLEWRLPNVELISFKDFS
jgi:hypothetical protein